MWRLLPPAVVSLSLAVAGILTILPASGQPAGTPTPTPHASPASPSPSPPPDPTPSPEPTPAPKAEPAKLPPSPGTWSPPPGYTGALRPGVWVKVTGTGSCLNVRVDPGLPGEGTAPGFEPDANVVNCLPDGFIGRLDEGKWRDSGVPVYESGHWWWQISGQGWVAEDWLAFYADAAYPFPQRPELADAGLIAFVREDGIGVMNADGSGARLLQPMNTLETWVRSLRWSPDGTRIAYDIATLSASGNEAVTRVIDLSGAVVLELKGFGEPNWSPDGRYLAGIRVLEVGEMGGYAGAPAVIDLTTGAESVVGPVSFYLTSPVWAPDGSAVAFICQSGFILGRSSDGQPSDCGGDGLRIVPLNGAGPRVILPHVEGVYIENPSWSPDGRTIAVHMLGDNAPCVGYVLVDVASGGVGRCSALPPQGVLFGGCGGSSEMGASDWSPDGRLLAYHIWGRTGGNGVVLVDTATGAQTLIPAMVASHVSFSPDGAHVSFAAGGYIWAAGRDGSGLTLLGEGSLAAWQPRR